jgi:hypothetical protein
LVMEEITSFGATTSTTIPEPLIDASELLLQVSTSTSQQQYHRTEGSELSGSTDDQTFLPTRRLSAGGGILPTFSAEPNTAMPTIVVEDRRRLPPLGTVTGGFVVSPSDPFIPAMPPILTTMP